MVNCASHSRLSRFARRLLIARLSAFLSTSASVEPRNFFERTIAESVFSPNDAEPAPMTVIFVGSVIDVLRDSLCELRRDADDYKSSASLFFFIGFYSPIVTSAVMPHNRF